MCFPVERDDRTVYLRRKRDSTCFVIYIYIYIHFSFLKKKLSLLAVRSTLPIEVKKKTAISLSRGQLRRVIILSWKYLRMDRTTVRGDFTRRHRWLSRGHYEAGWSQWLLPACSHAISIQCCRAISIRALPVFTRAAFFSQHSDLGQIHGPKVFTAPFVHETREYENPNSNFIFNTNFDEGFNQ